ncbi:hypothetical protein [Citrobacter farmeri]|uniref:hypothetical protein n=1 Tax=Citrobacter farmeri TaxID=67824 RepID=UPI00189FD39D|nr:hypothetical protein [Citrobacter farmeri]EHK0946867.1 hypothetical protein [Citrobacter farmeri]EKX4541972.1 hypothetical protein [Citrobacter farmeri]MDB2165975.1 hypothetical protein [Citrobacter farmeri]HBC0358794.1 hypothetical protein [Citrobacter farmeri]HBZ8836870.1 hypothetical protein [Citrobacter farmeri]
MMKDKMIYIVITPDLTKEKWITFCNRWDNQSNISLDTSLINSREAIEYIAGIAFINKGRDLSLSVMANLAEKKLTPETLLEMIFDIGDQACKEAVCLRDDLSDDLKNKCISTELIHGHCRRK